MSHAISVYTQELKVYSAKEIESNLHRFILSRDLYVDVPGLGLVNVSFKAAKDVVRRLHKEKGADRFCFQRVSAKHGLGDHARILTNYY